METPGVSNPIERRFMQAHDDWLTFAGNKKAKLLLWQANEADEPLLKTYFQVQEENACAVIQFDDVFETAEQFTDAIIKHIIHFYHQRREGAAAAGITADWHPLNLPHRVLIRCYLILRKALFSIIPMFSQGLFGYSDPILLFPNRALLNGF